MTLKRHALLIRRGPTFDLITPDDDGTFDDHLRHNIQPLYRRKMSRVQRVRFWQIDDEAYKDAVQTLKHDGYTVEVFSPPSAPPQKAEPIRRVTPAEADRAVLGVTIEAPWEVVEGAYRALANLYHPDKSTPVASNAEMARINLAYERLQKGRR